MKLMRKLSTVFLSNVRQFSGVASNCGLATISPEDVHKHVPTNAADFILERAQKLKPDNICVLKGGRDEWDKVLLTCQQQGLASKLAGLHNCYITRTDPADVARVESKTFIASSDKRTTVAQTRSGSPSQLGNWMSVDEMDQIFNQRYDGAMKGRTMYVIPFSMGIIGGQMFKLGIELTDSPYVAAAMSIMTSKRCPSAQILGITCPKGTKRYIAAAFPSACGKTNLAMLQSTLPGYKCVPLIVPSEVDFQRDGKPYWEGIDAELNAHEPIIDWQGRSWHPSAFSSPAAHPNSRFCIPATNLENLDEAFHSGDGVAIDAIMFGGRRPEGVPLVYESFNWQHGIYYGASMRSEATAAAEHKGKVLMHDPFAMRPFFGYNFGSYLQHWLDLAKKHPGAKLPRIYKVNWFRKCPKTGQFLWPGFGENIRVLDWIIRRCSGESGIAEKSELGFVPRRDKFRLDGLKSAVDWDALFSVDKNYWSKETKAVSAYLDEQVGDDLPNEIVQQKDALLKRLSQ